MGPKPSVDIYIKGVNEPYYLDLLILPDEEISLLDKEIYQGRIRHRYYQEKYPIEFLNGYSDPSGYVSATLYYNNKPFSLIKKDNYIKTGYHSPPKEFKVILVLENGNLIISKPIKLKLFNSKIIFDLSGQILNQDLFDAGVLFEKMPYFKALRTFILRVVFTIMIELVILVLFMYKANKSFSLVLKVNLITQTILTAFMVTSYYFFDPFFGLIMILFFGELLVYLIELLIYIKNLREKTILRAILYTIIANTVSLILSLSVISF